MSKTFYVEIVVPYQVDDVATEEEARQFAEDFLADWIPADLNWSLRLTEKTQ